MRIPMTILVTGATGFIGRHVALRLAQRGDDVVALVRETSAPWKKQVLEEAGIGLREGDVTDRDSVVRALDDVDGVVHCAAFVRLGPVDGGHMEATNVGGTRNVLGAAVEAGVARMLHTSSIAALGAHGSGRFDEDHPHPRTYHSEYDRTKHQSGLVATELAEAGAHIVQALPSVVFGRADPNFGVVFRNYMRRKIPVIPGPDTLVPFVHIDDLARGMVLAYDKGTPGRRYIFNQGELSIGAFFALVHDATGVRPPRFSIPSPVARGAVRVASVLTRPLPAHRRVRAGSAGILGTKRHYASDRAVAELGWQPGDLRERMVDTARYYAVKYGPREARVRLESSIPDPPRRDAPRLEVG